LGAATAAEEVDDWAAAEAASGEDSGAGVRGASGLLEEASLAGVADASASGCRDTTQVRDAVGAVVMAQSYAGGITGSKQPLQFAPKNDRTLKEILLTHAVSSTLALAF
jgi:hypothetical protein